MLHSGGDILAIQRESERPFFADVLLDGTTTSYTAKSSRGTNHAFFVQKIVLSIVTHANAKLVGVQDSNGTPRKIASHTDATAAAGVPSVVTWDFGPHGVQLTTAKDLLVTQDSSGVVGVVHLEGYEKLVVTSNVNATNSLN